MIRPRKTRNLSTNKINHNSNKESSSNSANSGLKITRAKDKSSKRGKQVIDGKNEASSDTYLLNSKSSNKSSNTHNAAINRRMKPPPSTFKVN